MNKRRAAIIMVSILTIPAASLTISCTQPNPAKKPIAGTTAIRHTIDSLYGAFSFAGGKQPAWGIIRHLSLPGAVFVSAPKAGVDRQGVGIEQFIADYKAYVANSPIQKTGYQEHIVSADISETDSVAVASVVFKASVTNETIKRLPGVDNIQLLLDHGHWKIVAFTTQAESDPEKE